MVRPRRVAFYEVFLHIINEMDFNILSQDLTLSHSGQVPDILLAVSGCVFKF